MAVKILDSRAFEHGRVVSTSFARPTERRWWERVIFYVADVDALYDRALAAGYRQLPCPTMPNGVSASST
jgi:hypothetical protein